MKHIHESAIRVARELVEIYKPLDSCQLEVLRYQKVIKFSLKRLYKSRKGDLS